MTKREELLDFAIEKIDFWLEMAERLVVDDNFRIYWASEASSKDLIGPFHIFTREEFQEAKKKNAAF